MILGVDVSRWQVKMDWAALKSNGVEFAVVKATQGNYTVDAMLRQHVDGATKAGLIVGVYHWCDPTVPADSQARFFLNAVNGLPFRFVSADVEQQWADWGEWSRGKVTKFLSPDVISQNAKTILDVWAQKLTVKRIVYTRASFITGYARPAAAWLANYPLWLAHYPYKNTQVTTTWEDLKTNYQPSIDGPSLPPNCSAWTFWQFSGDKFILPGSGNPIDLNYFNGDLPTLRRFAGLPDIQPAPQPTLTLEQRVAKLETEARSRGWAV